MKYLILCFKSFIIAISVFFVSEKKLFCSDLEKLKDDIKLDSKIQFNIGYSLFYSDLDKENGFIFLERSAYAGHGIALYCLANCYLIGEYIQKDLFKAKELYEISAINTGYGPSQFNLGIMAKNGYGCKFNFLEAYGSLYLASLNEKDLDDLTEDALDFCNRIRPYIDKEDLDKIHYLTKIGDLSPWKQ